MKQIVYVGTYTKTSPIEPHRKQGIYIYDFNPRSGEVTFLNTAENVENPSFLAVHPSKHYLYAVNELGNGQVSGFSIEPQTGAVKFINQQPTDGSAPCYVSFDPSGRFLLVSNYGSGNLAVFPIGEDGTLMSHSDLVQHAGSSSDQHRQENAHAHSIVCDPSRQFVLAADLGVDMVFVYRLDPDTGKLIANDPPGYKETKGAGPRHMTFHPNGKVFYLANELNSTVTVCLWDANKGMLTPFQTLSTLPEDFSGRNSVADIHITPDGQYLYVSNRGHQSLAKYLVSSDGKLTADGHLPTGGDWPRNFAIAPNGKFLLAANEHSNNLVGFAIDPKNGNLTPTGQTLSVPKPVCVIFAEL